MVRFLLCVCGADWWPVARRPSSSHRRRDALLHRVVTMESVAGRRWRWADGTAAPLRAGRTAAPRASTLRRPKWRWRATLEIVTFRWWIGRAAIATLDQRTTSPALEQGRSRYGRRHSPEQSAQNCQVKTRGHFLLLFFWNMISCVRMCDDERGGGLSKWPGLSLANLHIYRINSIYSVWIILFAVTRSVPINEFGSCRKECSTR